MVDNYAVAYLFTACQPGSVINPSRETGNDTAPPAFLAERVAVIALVSAEAYGSASPAVDRDGIHGLNRQALIVMVRPTDFYGQRV